MPRKSLLLAILASSVIFLISSAAPSSASAAANCTNLYASQTGNHAGAVRSYSQITNCTEVSAVRWYAQGSMPAGWSYTGWWDATGGYQVSSWLCGIGGCGSVTAYIEKSVPYPCSGQACGATLPYFINNCWYTGTHTLYPTFLFKIKNAITGTWGSLRQWVAGSGANVTC